MARADLLIRLMKSGSDVDQIAFQKAAEDLIAEEKRKGHRVLAERMHKALSSFWSCSGTSSVVCCHTATIN